MKFKKGVTRIVLIVFGYAFKIPNFTYCQLHFLQGCVGNASERLFTKQWKPSNNKSKNVGQEFSELVEVTYRKINPTLYCSCFGLIAIQKEVKPLNFDIKTRDDLREIFKVVCTDFKSENFGLLNGKIVCIDYA
jgi:hypothetical protein